MHLFASFMQSHIGRMHACLASVCHVHFWQNDRDLLRATAVARGGGGGGGRYRNKSQHCCFMGCFLLLLLLLLLGKMGIVYTLWSISYYIPHKIHGGGEHAD